MAIRIVLADDHPVVMYGLKTILENITDFEVVAMCTNGIDVMNAVNKHLPDILIIDIRMPNMDGLSVVREMNERRLPVKVILLTGELTPKEAIQCFKIGIKGVVLKGMDPQLLTRCVKKVSVGGVWMERHSFNQAMDKIIQQQEGLKEISRILTNREIEILKMVGTGLRNKEISSKMNISDMTVKTHLHNIFRKLEIKSRPQLIRFAQDKGLV